MKASTRRTLKEQGIDPDTTMGRIVAELIEKQEEFVRERDRQAREPVDEDGVGQAGS